MHEMFPDRYPHLLESSPSGASSGHDILFACPGQTLTLDAHGLVQLDESESRRDDFLRTFDRLWADECVSYHSDSGLPFTGGWFLYLGYELAQQIEPTLALPQTEDTGVIARATRFPAACIFDRLNDVLLLVSEPGFEHVLPRMEGDARASAPGEIHPADDSLPVRLEEEDPAIFVSNVEKILQYIHDGDVFQVNLSRKWSGIPKKPVTASAIYRHLRESNPGPFNGLATWNDLGIICSSPERLVKVKNGVIETRPIAGTRPRDHDRNRDIALSDELVRHPKERAEHIMLIDLERNDLGRVCEAGSVTVNELMSVESYAAVHHIVSNIRGRLLHNVTPGDVIRAVFPGGTITGCPKVRCMEIIAELEQVGRGAYTGSIGYVNHDGSMDLNILIRTMTLCNNRLSFRAGAGIVADSDARRELEETRDKARALLRVLDAAGAGV